MLGNFKRVDKVFSQHELAALDYDLPLLNVKLTWRVEVF